MLISISSDLFDPLGARTLNVAPASEVNSGARRMSRTATLDGGCYVVDQGYTVSDETWAITINAPSPDDVAFVERIVRMHSSVRVSTPQGLFRAVAQRWSATPAALNLTLAITERLT